MFPQMCVGTKWIPSDNTFTFMLQESSLYINTITASKQVHGFNLR